MTGQEHPWRPRPNREPFADIERRRSVRGRLQAASASASRPASRLDDPIGIRNGRIQQLDLETDNRMESDRLGRGDEADSPVEAGMIRDGETGQTQLDRSLDEVIGRRCPVEEREVGVAVEFGVWSLHRGSLRSRRLTGGYTV
jgi:hypothetical protein